MHDRDLGHIQNEATIIIFVATKEVCVAGDNLL